MSSENSQIKALLQKSWMPYVFPFVLFLLLTEPARVFPDMVPYLYVAKTILVAIVLWLWRHKYADDFSLGLTVGEVVTAISCGLLVLFLWIAPEGYFYQFEPGSGFNPYAMTGSQSVAITLIVVRIFGAAVVVPIMEELFWRSFLMRYLIDVDFRSVAMGAFTWLSFLGTAILFGLEHHRIVVGIIAGLLYTGLVVYQKKLRGVVLAHGVTNLGLGVYVIATGSWSFW
jgi:CAAX prenyl protease-like protein